MSSIVTQNQPTTVADGHRLRIGHKSGRFETSMRIEIFATDSSDHPTKTTPRVRQNESQTVASPTCDDRRSRGSREANCSNSQPENGRPTVSKVMLNANISGSEIAKRNRRAMPA